MDLLEAGIVTEETVIALERGLITEEEVATSIHQYLHGEQPIAGLILEATGEKISILEGIQKGIIKRGTGKMPLSTNHYTAKRHKTSWCCRPVVSSLFVSDPKLPKNINW